MSDNNIVIKPTHMSATSTFITPDRDRVIVTYYDNDFTHHVSEANNDGQGVSMKVKVDLIPQMAISLSPAQAIALAKTLQHALEETGLWK